ncbi:MAG TPA: hypothetical protein VLL97_08345, partial [Acidobacteriota bacterium]|nr:hypothetical protein [Acidobacteriota bacterium]
GGQAPATRTVQEEAAAPDQPQARSIREQLNAPKQAVFPVPESEAAGPSHPVRDIHDAERKKVELAPSAPAPSWEEQVTKTPPAPQHLPIYPETPASSPAPVNQLAPQPIPQPQSPAPVNQLIPQQEQPAERPAPQKKQDAAGPLKATINSILSQHGIPAELFDSVIGHPVGKLDEARAKKILDLLQSKSPAELDQLAGELMEMKREAEIKKSPAKYHLSDAVQTPRGRGVVFETRKDPTAGWMYLVKVKKNFEYFTQDQLKPAPKRGGFRIDPTRSLENAVIYEGGINPEMVKKEGLWGEWERIPLSRRRRITRKNSTHPIAEIAERMIDHGYQDIDGNNLLYLLADDRTAKQGTGYDPKNEEFDQLLAEYESIRRERDELAARLEQQRAEEGLDDENLWAARMQDTEPNQPPDDDSRVGEERSPYGRVENKKPVGRKIINGEEYFLIPYPELGRGTVIWVKAKPGPSKPKPQVDQIREQMSLYGDDFALKGETAGKGKDKLTVEQAKRQFEAEKERRKAKQGSLLPDESAAPLFDQPAENDSADEQQKRAEELDRQLQSEKQEPGTSAADLQPIASFASDMTEAQQRQRNQARREAQQRILHAPESRTGKREQLGLSKPKDARVEGPLFGKEDDEPGLFKEPTVRYSNVGDLFRSQGLQEATYGGDHGELAAKFKSVFESAGEKVGPNYRETFVTAPSDPLA